MAKVNNMGIRDQVIAVLKPKPDTWQTASIIAGQIIFRPEAIKRYSASFYRSKGYTQPKPYTRSHHGAATSLTCWVLHAMLKSKQVERRKNQKGKWEYRLIESAVCKNTQ